MKAVLAVLSVLILSTVAKQLPASRKDSRCPAVDSLDYTVHIPHELDCSKFYTCSNGEAIVSDCPEGQHFNAISEVCDLASRAGCQPSTTTVETPTTEPHDPRCPAVDPLDYTVHLPHETDCTKFYKCDNGKVVIFDCPGGTHFNPTLWVCDWPHLAGCQSNTPPTVPTTTEVTKPTEKPTTSRPTDPRCPAINSPDHTVHLPHESDCTKFYICDWGVAVPSQCPDGLHFNPTLEVCDWPADAGCEEGATNKPPVVPEEPCDTTTEDGGDGGSTTTGRPTDPRCPAINRPDHTVHLPHETDCTKFYICDWGVAVPSQCPDGLHFNPTLEVCDWPADAGCEEGATNKPPVVPEEPCDTTTEDGGDGSSTTTGRPTDPRCPAINRPDHTVHLPHETDCTKFYICDWGVAVPSQCPDGLHFNPTLEVCDWPADAGCEEGATNKPPVVPEEPCDTTTEDGGDGGSTTTGRPTDPRCPAINRPDHTVHLPHETDCTKFYICDWGVAVPSQCPDGLHFNPTLEVCDWPADAGCEEGATNKPPVVPEEPCDTTTEDGGDGGSTTTSRPTDPRCPAINRPDHTVHLPHETDCTKFYICDWGVAVPSQCPDGLHFNPTLEVCDWPAGAGCEEGATNKPPVVPEEPCDTTTEDGGDGGSTTTGRPTDPRCPAINRPDHTVHLPHETDCTKFYICDWGVAVPSQCPDGLHFNPTLEVCDWPADAGCEEGATNKPPVVSEEPCDTTTVDGGDGSSTTTGRPTDPRCPAINRPDHTVHLPHETDCTKFYICDWGVAVPSQCPDGLHFNPTLEVCDWPADAGCEEGATNKPPVVPEEPCDTTTEDGGDGGSTTTSRPTDPRCPAINRPDHTVHLPHETDCTKFYICDWGVAVPSQCPDGLHFNPTLEVCDWPADAGCEEGATNKPPVVPEEPCDTTTEDGGDGGSTTTSRPTDPRCPAINRPDHTVHLPHETDCTKFYICDWGVAVPSQCPDGLHFNPTLEVCDWPADAGCEEGATNKPPVVTEEPCDTTTEDGGDGGSTTTSRPTDPRCPAINRPDHTVHLPHEYDCTKFYICDWGVAVPSQCPDGLHFNPTLEVCDWPADAGCEEGATNKPPVVPEEPCDTTTEDGGSTTTSRPTDPRCPAINRPDHTVHLPHETDCTKFYICDWGVAVPSQCPDGLHFNPTLEVCDWPADAGCEEGATNKPPVVPEEPCDTTTEDGGDGGSTTTPRPQHPDCPAENHPDYTVHLPHEDDCTKFYICDWGVAVPSQCPDGLHFNPTLQVCDWPWDAGCDKGATTKPPVETEVPVDPPCETTPEGSTTTPRPQHPDCPAENHPDYTVHLPHEDDCTKFYICDWGVAVPSQCPDGLHFNPILQVCDWPWDAGCDKGATTKPPVETEVPVDPPCETTPEGSTTTPSPHHPDCPAENHPDYTVHLPHEDDCSKFYICDWGVAVPSQCPDGLHFNPILQVCDWPWDAGCDKGATTKPPVETEVPVDPPCETTPEGSTTTPSPHHPDCPAENHPDYTVHLPHEDDCSKFYICDWGVAVPSQCPDGLHFNPTLQVCDWPWDAGCDKGATTKPPVETEVPVDPPCETTPEGSTTTPRPQHPDCPAENHPDYTVHLPHEDDCSKFYICDWGVAVPSQCPDGLHFNPTLQVCDWPWDAGCDKGATTKPPVETEVPVDPPCETTPEGSTTTPRPEHPDCPAENHPDYTVHLPHEDDCTKFYICDWGVAVPSQCPDGLHFNPTLQVCDWPWDAGCDKGATTKPPVETEVPVDPPCETTPEGSTTTPRPQHPDCPAENHPDYTVHLPHEDDCSKFYICDWGVAVPSQCPDGLHFNPILQVCDWPWDAGCDKGATTKPPVDPEVPVDPPCETTPNPPPVEECPPAPKDPRCPVVDPLHHTIHLPHEKDCTKFYKCSNGDIVLYNCPDGLHFNDKLWVCDWPQNAGCDSNSITTEAPCDTLPTDPTTSAPSTTIQPPTCVINPDPVCPSTTLQPHQTRCDQFWQCNWNNPVLHTCPPGLQFNTRIQVCDWPRNVNCVQC